MNEKKIPPRLWAPWRMEYILSEKSEECIFCDVKDLGNLKDKYILKLGKTSFVILNIYPYTNGHLMVVPYSHKAELGELTAEENLELQRLLNESIRILKEAINPEGFNLGMNLGKAAGAGVDAHLHWHVVPRWVGDVNFMPVLSDTRVMIQHLDDTYEQLLPFYNKINL
jgi:ATP adenylyltransferase